MHYDSIQIQIFQDVQHNRTLKNFHFFYLMCEITTILILVNLIRSFLQKEL